MYKLIRKINQYFDILLDYLYLIEVQLKIFATYLIAIKLTIAIIR